YSRFDKANLHYEFSDLFRVFSPDAEFQHKADSTRNWLGIFGAYISDFFINSTLGIFSAVFPIMFFIWGFSFFQKINFRFIIHTSNFLLISGILLASFFGVVRSHYNLFANVYELSGGIGDYTGDVLRKLLGGIGSLLFLTGSMVVLLIIVFDLKIEKIFQFLKNVFSHSVNTIKEEYKNSGIDEKQEENLEKIKSLRQEKKKAEKTKKKIPAEIQSASAEELMEKEAEEQTRIRIIRKNDEPAADEKNIVQEEESKKVDLVKTGEVQEAQVDRTKEAELPNNWEEKINYKKPGLDLLEAAPEEDFKVAEEELTRNAELLKEKLKLFDIDIQD